MVSEWKSDLCVLGETKLLELHWRKADAVWHRGLWLVVLNKTDEHTVGTELGSFFTGNVRRLPVE